MTNEIFLSVTKDNNTITLFEERLSLPFFWICLLDHEIISSKTPYWDQAYRCIDFEDEDTMKDESIDKTATLITISKERFHINATTARRIIEKDLNPALPLYDDFIACIDNHLSLGSVVNIDIIKYICFYESLQEFIRNINKEIASIKEQNIYGISYLTSTDLISTGTGFTSIDNKSFKELNAYKQADENRYNDEIVPDPNLRQKNKRGLIYFFIIVIFVIIMYNIL